MAEKIMQSRIILKHDIEENWLKAVNFIPKLGEMIIYDIDSTYDYERVKIGDGVTLVSDLPFLLENAGGGMTAKTYNATLLASGWTGAAAPYSQVVTVTGLAEDNIAVVELVQTRNETTDAELRKNVSLVTSIVPATNSITAYASKIPEVDLPIQIVAFEKGSASGDSSGGSSNITVDQTVVADSENPVSGAAVADYAFPKDQIVPTTVDPGEGAVVDYPDGTVIFVHE